MILAFVAVSATSFVVGKEYGARLQKEAVTIALAAFTKARVILANVIAKARAEAQAEVIRLEDVAKKYL
jgi:hypothetical protein